MKFDCVLTNPPYQDSSHTEKKNTLWRKWLGFMDIIVKDGGVFSLVIPSSWMGSAPVLKESFFIKGSSKIRHNITHINRDECRRHFPGVGSTFSYFISEKINYEGNTTIVSKSINGNVDISNDVNLNDCIEGVFPRDLNVHGLSILRKTLNNGVQKLGVINNTYNHSVHRTKWRLTQDDEFCYPIQNTPSKLYWYNYPHPDQGKKKLLIPTTTYFRNQMISSHGVTQSFCYFIINDEMDEDVVIHNVNNKLFDYLNECFRYANWNSVNLLRKLPMIPLTKKLSDNDIYEFFNLNDEEIKHINELVTWR